MAEKLYPKGVRCFAPRQGAPDWVLGQILITPHELLEWIAANQQYMGEYQGNPQLKLDLLKGKDGPYIAVNTYQAQKSGQAPVDDSGPSIAPTPPDDLPF